MWWLLQVLAIVALSISALFWYGSVLFGGESFPVPVCQSITWVQGDTTKSKGVERVSPCSGGVF